MVTHHIFLEQYKQKGNIKISHLGSEVFLLLECRLTEQTVLTNK